jgi:tRNA(adenine34) deaminase
MTKSHEFFMEVAIEEARRGESEGNVPVGGVLVRDGKIVAKGHNTATSTLDVTAHGEAATLREASLALGEVDLHGCTLYSTMEPCPMCCGAIMVSRVSTLVLGARITEASGSKAFGEYRVEKMLDMALWQGNLELVTGVLLEECQEIRNAWRKQYPHRSVFGWRDQI